MNLDLFKKLLETPSHSGDEDAVVDLVRSHVNERGVARCGRVATDSMNNVYIVKGEPSAPYPCFGAHMDTVYPIGAKVNVELYDNDAFYGLNKKGERAGIGGDDKAGIMVCLEALERLDRCAIALFVSEENGCNGSLGSLPAFFDLVSYFIEFDCPGRGMSSYTNNHVRLFENNGEFIKKALPVLNKRGPVNWQRHPYTDVMAIRRMHPVSCLNLSCGYYNYHRSDEYVCVSEVAEAVDIAVELVEALGSERYVFPVKHTDVLPPLFEVKDMCFQDKFALGLLDADV